MYVYCRLEQYSNWIIWATAGTNLLQRLRDIFYVFICISSSSWELSVDKGAGSTSAAGRGRARRRAGGGTREWARMGEWALRANGPRWRAASARHRPVWRGYYVCAPPPPKLAAGLLQHCAQGPLQDQAGEGSGTASSSAAPDAPHRAAATLSERAAAVRLSSFIMMLLSIASFSLISASSFWA